MSFTPAKLVSVPAPFLKQCDHMENGQQCVRTGRYILITNERKVLFRREPLYEVHWLCDEHNKNRLT